MTKDEMREHCESQINLIGESADVVFTMPGKWRKKDTRRLWPGGPKGRVVRDNFGDGLRVMFSAREVLDALEQIDHA